MSKQFNKNEHETFEAKLLRALEKQAVNEECMITAIQELVKWNKVTSHAQVGEILNQQVHTIGQKIVYANSDGIKSTKELSELSGIDSGNISRDWKQWAQVGIVEQVPARGGSRGKSLFSLEEFGIEAPKSNPDKAQAKIGNIQ
jgi:hypothetical protein